MVTGITRLPRPAFSQDNIVICFIEIPGIIAVVPCTAADKAVADTIVHLTGEAISIRAVVRIAVTVVV